MNVVDVMSKLLLKVSPDATLRHASQLFHLYKVCGLVVISAVSLAAFALLPARLRTSCATTANPLPC